MEVHKHPHDVTHKKKWGEYLLEFLMLFLAVFLGFIAENVRENSNERHREKQYIASLIEDIKLDTASLYQAVQGKSRILKKFDSLTKLLLRPEFAKDSTNEIYYFARFLPRTSNFTYHIRTIAQLKNSGGLRLIRLKQVSDIITIYDNDVVSYILFHQENEEKERQRCIERMGNVFDVSVFESITDGAGRFIRPVSNPRLITNDRKTINNLVLQIHFLKISFGAIIGLYDDAIKKAVALIQFLQKEYHLE